MLESSNTVGAGCEIAELHRTAEKRRRLSEAHTQRSRSKAKECWTPNSRTFWTLNGDPRCINQFVHSHHCRSPHKRKISNNIKEYICEHGETMMVHQLIDAETLAEGTLWEEPDGESVVLARATALCLGRTCPK